MLHHICTNRRDDVSFELADDGSRPPQHSHEGRVTLQYSFVEAGESEAQVASITNAGMNSSDLANCHLETPSNAEFHFNVKW
jgi:hypothetical protein